MSQQLIDDCQQALDSAGLPWTCDHAEDARIHTANPASAPEATPSPTLQPANGRRATVIRSSNAPMNVKATTATGPGKNPPA